MDPRYNLDNIENNIFEKRTNEWNEKEIETHFTNLFKYLELNEGWKFIKVKWNEDIKDNKKKEELKKNIYKTLSVFYRPPDSDVVSLDFKIPTLINKQFFYIGGFLKIPIFQLYDYPIIYRKTNLSNKKKIKFRNNILSINLITNKENIFKISLFNKVMNFHELIAYIYDKDIIDNFLNSYPNINDILKENSTLSNTLKKCMEIWKDTTKEEGIKKLGKIFSTTKKDHEKKGKGIIFSLNSAFEIDIFNKKFCKTDSIIFELLNAILEGSRSDTDLKNKRVRFSEYILTPIIRQVYDMVVSAYNSKNKKFTVPSTLIIDKCNSSGPKDKFNVSHIIHYNSAVNPISELAPILQLSLTGPGGFKRENVPGYLRTIDESQKGFICPADTPDRDGCGVILNMTPTIKLNEDGTFKEPSKETIISYPISLVPFLANDDQTRLQMASSQLKQSILLKEGEPPIIRSGTEDVYLENTSFLHKAKHDGKVIYKDPDYLVVYYNDDKEKGEVFKLGYRNMHLTAADYVECLKNENDEFKKGELLCKSSFIKDDNLSYGRNLLTVITIGKGYNYEDGIVISESAAKKFTSSHYLNLNYLIERKHVLFSLRNDSYQPFPHVGDELKIGDVYAKLKILNTQENLEDIQAEENLLRSPRTCRINSLELYPNFWNSDFSEYTKEIEKLIFKQTNRYNLLIEKLKLIFNNEDLEKFIILNDLTKWNCNEKIGKYYEKNKKINGILVKMQGVYEDPAIQGDKLANRHGNKGVIAKILPDNEMPVLEDGRVAEIIINPLGIISRINVGQIYEITLSETLYQLKGMLKKLDKDEKRIELLENYLQLIDNTKDKWPTKEIVNKFKENLKSNGLKIALNKLYIIQPAFQSINKKQLDDVIEFTNTKYIQRVFDPQTNKWLDNEVTVGYIYFEKLIHRSSEKISARSIGPYSNKTLQPLGGKSNQGGHRMGEMEIWSLFSHGALNLLSDLFTTQSDSIGKKNKLLSGDIIKNQELENASEEEDDDRPQSLNLLDAYFKVLGVELSINE